MTRYLATFSGSKYHDTTARIVNDSPCFGVDKVMVFDDFWLRKHRAAFCDQASWFFRRNNKSEGKPRGVCWFVWKPLVVLDAFNRMADGDVLLYSDADTFPIADLTPFYDRCVSDGGALLFGARGCIQKVWTKRDAFILTGSDEPKYHDAWQAVARFMLFQKGGMFPVEKFLGEWLGFTANPMVNTFEPSVLAPEYPEYREGRAEQAVLGILRVKYGLPLYREACEFGCWDGPPDLNREIDFPGYRTFSQVGSHSYRPGFREGNEGEGSAFRNVQD